MLANPLVFACIPSIKAVLGNSPIKGGNMHLKVGSFFGKLQQACTAQALVGIAAVEHGAGIGRQLNAYALAIGAKLGLAQKSGAATRTGFGTRGMSIGVLGHIKGVSVQQINRNQFNFPVGFLLSTRWSPSMRESTPNTRLMFCDVSPCFMEP